jgi:hypothetical protein
VVDIMIKELIKYILDNKTTHHVLLNGEIVIKDYIEVDKLLDKLEEMDKFLWMK